MTERKITGKEKYKNELLKKMEGFLSDSYHLIVPYESEQSRDEAYKIECELIERYGMSQEQIDLVKEMCDRFAEYNRLKHGGYCLTGNGEERYCIKNGKRVDPKFWLVDNGIGDLRAVKAAYAFQTWLRKTGITKLDWMLEADLICPAIFKVEEYSFEGFEEVLKEFNIE
jgi:hypothetical protein